MALASLLPVQISSHRVRGLEIRQSQRRGQNVVSRVVRADLGVENMGRVSYVTSGKLLSAENLYRLVSHFPVYAAEDYNAKMKEVGEGKVQ
jgi:hypothetical protein